MTFDSTRSFQNACSFKGGLKPARSVNLALCVLLFSLIWFSGCSSNPTGGNQQGVTVQRAWVDHSEGGSHASIVSMVLYNRSEFDDRLQSASSDLTDHIAIHGYEYEDGMEVMVPHDDVIIRGNDRLRFKKGMFHLMLMDLKQPLGVGDEVHLKLRFEQSGMLELVVPVAHSAKIRRPLSHRRGGR